jgi:hypothetical protein
MVSSRSIERTLSHLELLGYSLPVVKTTEKMTRRIDSVISAIPSNTTHMSYSNAVEHDTNVVYVNNEHDTHVVSNTTPMSQHATPVSCSTRHPCPTTNTDTNTYTNTETNAEEELVGMTNEELMKVMGEDSERGVAANTKFMNSWGKGLIRR